MVCMASTFLARQYAASSAISSGVGSPHCGPSSTGSQWLSSALITIRGAFPGVLYPPVGRGARPNRLAHCFTVVCETRYRRHSSLTLTLRSRYASVNASRLGLVVTLRPPGPAEAASSGCRLNPKSDSPRTTETIAPFLSKPSLLRTHQPSKARRHCQAAIAHSR